MMWALGIATKIATIPNAISPSSAQNSVRPHGEPEQQAESEQQSDRELPSAPRRGEVEGDDACERADEQDEAGRTAQVAPEVGAERGERHRDGDGSHDLAEKRSSVALDGLATKSRLVVGGLHRAHGVTPDSSARFGAAGTAPGRSGVRRSVEDELMTVSFGSP